MKKLATLTAAAALMLGFAMSIGTNAALAGGGSATSGEGSHCYAFFNGFPTDPGEPAKFV